MYCISRLTPEITSEWGREVARRFDADSDICIVDPGLRRKLSGHIRQGIKLRLMGTPGFVIDNEVYVGKLPAKVLEKYFN